MSEPPVKRRKVEGRFASVVSAENRPVDAAGQAQVQDDSNISASVTELGAQPSFASILARMNDSAKETQDTQGGTKLWARPELPDVREAEDEITLQLVEIEDSNTESVFRLYGVTKNGNSVLVHVTGFNPYLYIISPSGFKQEDTDAFKAYLNNQISSRPVLDVSLVDKHDIMDYKGEVAQVFIKIEATSQAGIMSIHNKCRYNAQFGVNAIETYEAKVPYALKFMVDKEIKGLSWLTLPAGGYTLVTTKSSYCQLEVSITWDKLIVHSHEDFPKVAPLRILSFDIETAVRILADGRDVFPKPEYDQIYQISNMVTTPGGAEPFIRNVYTIGSCTSIDGAQILSFATEAQMLSAWRDFVRQVDPDIITGFNIGFFDLPFILGRATKCKIPKFGDLGRRIGVPSPRPQTEWFEDPSMPKGKRSVTETPISGRIVMDMWQYIRREFKFDMSKREYQLESLSGRFLGDGKEGVHFKQITPLFNSGPDGRAKLAIYCLKDSYLSLRLMERLRAFECIEEMARVTGVPFSWILSHGPPMKVLSLLLSNAREQNYVITTLKRQVETAEERYCTPHFRFHSTPRGELDYWKWRPDDNHDPAKPLLDGLPEHIKMLVDYNICYSTHLGKNVVDDLSLTEGKDYVQTPKNVLCVSAAVKEGVLPKIIQHCVRAREQTRDTYSDLDPLGKKIMYGMQLSWNLLAEVVYSFVTSGKLPRCPGLPPA